MQAFDSLEVLEIAEVASVVNEYRRATVNAFDAGFDAVELHCTSSYLPAQMSERQPKIYQEQIHVR